MKSTITLSLLLAAGLASSLNAADVKGWLAWRGPNQNGTSMEKGLPDSIDPKKPLWVVDYPGQSTSVIANGKLYIMGYLGEGPELQEGVACFDAETGKKLWEKRYCDFLSDTIYLRYATSSPAVDPETGNVYMQCTQGILSAFTADGKQLWTHSMMEEFGRLTFPNSRTGSPLIDGDLVIVRGITANWGANGPAGDRIYAFDKKTGELVWTSGTGERPRDNSYSHPYTGWWEGKRVLYTATGDGNVFCLNARTGQPLWRVPIFRAGINATVLVHNEDKVIAIYGTPYEPGMTLCLNVPHHLVQTNAQEAVVIDHTAAQLWQAKPSTSASSPILVGDRMYVVAEKGELSCIDVNTGKILWGLKLGIEQRNSSLVYADGKLYVPILDDPDTKTEGGEAGTTGGFYIIKPSDTEGKIIAHVALDGRCFGTPTPYNGKIYMQTTKHLYCFGKAGNNPGLPPAPAPEKWPAAGPAKSLQIIPSEVLLKPGDVTSFRVRRLDANGLTVDEIKDPKAVKWESYIPPTAKVKSTMKGAFNAEGKLVAAPDLALSAGAFMATADGLRGVFRGRVMPGLPIKQDFESFAVDQKHETEEGVMFAYPPLPWIGARFKFEVREKDGNKALTKTIDNRFFQRATVFMGDPRLKNYTIEADVMSDGNKRKMSDVGIINQKYLIELKGNEKKLEVTSNQDLFKHSVPFDWKPSTWYHLKARVDMAPDGSAVIRGKAWEKGQPEPAAWTIEAPHKLAFENGCPGLFGFAPQDQRVYIDNISVTSN